MSLHAILGREDPTPWLLASDEPQARWIARPDAATHAEVLAHPATERLLEMLPASWEEPTTASGHNKPELSTNVLDLLAEFGVTEADDPRIGTLLDGMLEHTDADGRFLAHGAQHGGPPVWGCVPCDTHAIVDVLGRFGRASDPRLRRALAAAESDLMPTDLGLAWGCRPDPATGFRGPGRKSEPCPQTTLEALRAFSWLPADERPAQLAEVAHTALEVWRQRATRKPYMMGHGRQFKTVKWPPTWYGAYEVVDTLGRLPELWRGVLEDRVSMAEITACLLAYNVSADGRVTPLSAFKGWEWLSLGDKKQPSPIATAMVWARLQRRDWLAEEIAAVDVMRLASSKGGSGTPMAPRV
jgi:hypothetical protein